MTSKQIGKRLDERRAELERVGARLNQLQDEQARLTVRARQLQGVIMEFENILEPPVKLEDIKVVEDGED
jgi:predicted nuclease with TOPRIM domain